MSAEVIPLARLQAEIRQRPNVRVSAVPHRIRRDRTHDDLRIEAMCRALEILVERNCARAGKREAGE